jgi:hypothetical protein
MPNRAPVSSTLNASRSETGSPFCSLSSNAFPQLSGRSASSCGLLSKMSADSPVLCQVAGDGAGIYGFAGGVAPAAVPPLADDQDRVSIATTSAVVRGLTSRRRRMLAHGGPELMKSAPPACGQVQADGGAWRGQVPHVKVRSRRIGVGEVPNPPLSSGLSQNSGQSLCSAASDDKEVPRWLHPKMGRSSTTWCR